MKVKTDPVLKVVKHFYETEEMENYSIEFNTAMGEEKVQSETLSRGRSVHGDQSAPGSLSLKNFRKVSNGGHQDLDNYEISQVIEKKTLDQTSFEKLGKSDPQRCPKLSQNDNRIRTVKIREKSDDYSQYKLHQMNKKDCATKKRDEHVGRRNENNWGRSSGLNKYLNMKRSILSKESSKRHESRGASIKASIHSIKLSEKSDEGEIQREMQGEVSNPKYNLPKKKTLARRLSENKRMRRVTTGLKKPNIKRRVNLRKGTSLVNNKSSFSDFKKLKIKLLKPLSRLNNAKKMEKRVSKMLNLKETSQKRRSKRVLSSPKVKQRVRSKRGLAKYTPKKNQSDHLITKTVYKENNVRLVNEEEDVKVTLNYISEC